MVVLDYWYLLVYFMSIIVSAPGKIHLLGEHAVVYGKPALLAAIDKRLYVEIRNPTLRLRSGQESGIRKKEEIVIHTTEKKDLAWETIKVFQKAFSIDNLPPLEINITSQIPVGSGLGSSAALSAAMIGALMKFVKNIWNPNRINELVYEVEKIAHGNPSGADNTTVVFGGLVWFRREFDFLKSIWSLPISAYKIPHFVLIDTGRPMESTKEMVSLAAKQYDENRRSMENIFNDQEKETKKLLLSLRTGNMDELVSAIRSGERNLEKIGVVGDLAKKIIRDIEDMGGAAKICGAGGKKKGSGVLLCYHEDLSKIKKVAEKSKVSVSPVKLGGEGIRIENNPINQLSNNPIIQ